MGLQGSRRQKKLDPIVADPGDVGFVGNVPPGQKADGVLTARQVDLIDEAVQAEIIELSKRHNISSCTAAWILASGSFLVPSLTEGGGFDEGPGPNTLTGLVDESHWAKLVAISDIMKNRAEITCATGETVYRHGGSSGV